MSEMNELTDLTENELYEIELREKELRNLKNRADKRRAVLNELGFQNVDRATDSDLDELTPQGIRRAYEEVKETKKIFRFGPIQALIDMGVDVPVDLRNEIERHQVEEARKERERQIELAERRKFNNLPKIYREQMFAEGYTTPQEVSDRLRDISRELINILKDGIDAHHDIVKKSGAAYRWGPGVNNDVQESMERTLSQLNNTQKMWLLRMYENGTWFSDTIDYDSKGDGKHTRYLYSARNILESAKDVGHDGIHPQYGSLSLQSMKTVFKHMSDSEYEMPKTFATPDEEKVVKDILDSESGYAERRLGKR